MDQINESVDILIQYDESNDDSDHVQMIKLPPLIPTSTRPLYSIQQRNIASIRQYFKEKNWLLLSTYATMNTMYLCNKIEFEQKLSEYLIQTKAFTFMKDCSEIDQDDVKCFFNDLNRYIEEILFYLLFHHQITMEQYTQMKYTSKRSEIPINSIIFLPDTRMPGVPFRPMLLNASGSIISIAQYLYRYLHATYSLIANSTTFHDGMDVVKSLEIFANQGLLSTSTQFVTLEIKDFDISFNHQQVIRTLKCFLHDFSSHLPSTSNLSNETVIALVRLILETQYFTFENKLYRQTQGSNPDSSLTKLLIDIYLFYWQQDLMQILSRKKELFGRCFNHMFFTWNGSKREFHSTFHRIKEKLPNLPIKVSVGTSIHYLDIDITHCNGILQTKVYRSTLTEPYTLPYFNKYQSNYYTDIIRTHLNRAIHICTNMKDFQNERLFIYSTCLLNRFPLHFIDNCVRQFFHEFNPSKLNYQYNQTTYECLRRHVMMDASELSSLSTNHKRPRHTDLDPEPLIKRIKTTQ